MSHHPRRIAPALLASLLAAFAATAAARAESAPASSTTDCLAKPNAPAPKGGHWYYHLDRPSGRHCWYQRPIDAARSESAQPRSTAARATPPRVAAPADNPAPAVQPDTLADQADGGRSVVPPVAASPRSDWPAAAAPAAAEPMAAPAADSAVPQPASPAAVDSNVEARPTQLEPTQIEMGSSQRNAPPAPAVERVAAPAEESAHMPALLGAGLALFIVILGSIGVRLGSRLLGWPRRRRIAGPPPHASPVFRRLQDSPDLVPAMPRQGDIVRETWAPPAPDGAPRRERSPAFGKRTAGGDNAAAPTGETAQVLEQNVRELLSRLRTDLRDKPRTPVTPAAPAPSTESSDLDEVLAMWRGRRRKPAG